MRITYNGVTHLWNPFAMPAAIAPDQFKDRINFILELARHLHTAGTSVNRLEGAIEQVARQLELQVSIWSNPTGIMISFSDPLQGEPYTITRVLRLEPGSIHLGRLADADAIAEQVMEGRLDIQAGLARLSIMDQTPSAFFNRVQVASFGVASAMVVSLFPRTGWYDLATSAVLGMLIGVLTLAWQHRARLNDAVEAIAAFLATLLVSFIASHWAPLSVQPVIISALIILMPGMMLTNALNELAHQQLASGSARFAGAMTVLMKLTFGAILAVQVVENLGWQNLSNSQAMALPAWMPWAMLLPGAVALALLFKTHWRDVPVVVAAVLLGYGIMKWCAQIPVLSDDSMPTGVFLAAFAVTAIANIFARWFNRPGALIRVPGIILLVPGSLGFRTINMALAQDVMSSLDLAIALIAALTALVAGILFGNLLVSSRRNL
jgi:uncharacterized membrane protein YjjP (DUF1212 family)